MSSPRQRAESFVAGLADLRFGDVFNPYSDVCAEHDLPNAPAIRRRNLRSILENAMRLQVRSIWIGLELGRGGGRRTGLAMTDDAHLLDHAERFGTREVRRATQSGPTTELTAGAVWTVLKRIHEPVLLWNVFPLHPHKPGIPLSNRRHSREEQIQCRPFLDGLLSMLEPEIVVTIGNEAREVLAKHGRSFQSVRHPAYGGKVAFIRGIDAIYQP